METIMAYRADLYSPENIVGYTGCIHNNPTVYFQTDTEFGRITQAHPSAWNIGREEVGDRYPGDGWEYVIKKDDRGNAQERYEHATEGRVVLHTSRNPFNSTQRANIDVFAVLAQAIWGLTDKKRGEPLRARR